MCQLCLELLKTKLGSKCPRIIRVYSEMLENQVFPIPRDSLQVGGSRKGRRYELIDKDDQRDISLHHLIRKESNKFARKIREFDRLFEANHDTPENVTDEKVCFYLLFIDCFLAHFDMHHLIFGINFQILSISLTSLVLIHLLIHLPTHISHRPRSHHPSLLHSFTPGSKPPFQQILPTLDFF